MAFGVIEVGRVYLANAFSLNMLGLDRERPWASVCVKRLEPHEWASRLALALDSVDCAIGHEATQQLADLVLRHYVGHRLDRRCERKMIVLEPGDTVYIIQLKFRAPEGKVYDYGEIVQLLRQGRIGFYAVHYGPC